MPCPVKTGTGFQSRSRWLQLEKSVGKTDVMRIKVVIPLLLVGLLVAGLPFVFRPKHTGLVSATMPVISAAKAPAPGDGSSGQQVSRQLPATPENNLPDPHITIATGTEAPPPAEYEDYVNRRTAELEDLGMAGDASALLTIESELDSRDPRIQKAAVSAAIQFGSRNAVPALQEAYGHTDDPAQKLNLRKAIEFLELPSESESAKANLPANGGSTAN